MKVSYISVISLVQLYLSLLSSAGPTGNSCKLMPMKEMLSASGNQSLGNEIHVLPCVTGSGLSSHFFSFANRFQEHINFSFL